MHGWTWVLWSLAAYALFSGVLDAIKQGKREREQREQEKGDKR